MPAGSWHGLLNNSSKTLHTNITLSHFIFCKTHQYLARMLENNLTMIKQRPSSCAHLPSPFQSPNLLPSLSVAASARNRGFYITDDMSVELQIKNVCRSVYSAARLVIKAHKRDDVSTLLRTRHWLPIQARIEYKLSTLWHSIVSVRAPVYLSDLPRIYCPSRQLRFYSNSRTSRIPHMKTNTFGDR